ncbi:hypothetical protein ACFYUY_22990 [Kitasatospora sp. NPDC004745]
MRGTDMTARCVCFDRCDPPARFERCGAGRRTWMSGWPGEPVLPRRPR